MEVSQVLTGKPPYKYVNVYTDEGKRVLRRVHNLLAKTHIPNPDNLPMVDHKDQDRFNNHVSNLRWVTRTQNQQNMRNNVIPGGVPKFLREFYPDYHRNQAIQVRRHIQTGLTLKEACEKVFPSTPFPPQKDKPSL
ncbi:hypothetical protein D3C84_952030 [compost metagenome]